MVVTLVINRIRVLAASDNSIDREIAQLAKCGLKARLRAIRYKKQRRIRWKKRGLCTECGSPCLPYTKCLKCRKERSIWLKGKREKTNAKIQSLQTKAS